MIRLIQRRLIIPRGDTGTFSIPVLTSSNMGDVSIFTIFNPLTHKKIAEKRMELSDGVLTVTFSHGDTVNLPAGQYVWDIKFYKNPVFAGEQLIDGEEIDSYYAAFSLPVCEIRETGDSLLMDDDTPQAKLAPDQIDLISAAITATQTAKEVAVNSAADAETSASAAATSAQVALDSKDAALASQTSAATSESNAAESAAAAQVSATQAAQIAQQIHEEIPTKVSDLVDDSGHYTKPTNGIPASDLEETYLTSFTETDPTVPNWAKQAQKPSYTAQEVGALPADTVIPTVPTNVSAFTNDAGYLTEHQDISGKVNAADLAAIATSGSYEDLSDKPTIPEVPVQDVQIEGTSILENGVASIPIASYTAGNAQLGLVRTYGLGIQIDNNTGELSIKKASNGQIKRGSGESAPIVAETQHQSTFYGLAKAAGDTTQSQSDNAVGTYTDSAKTAIQTMLDVPSNAAMTTAISNAIGNINSFDMAVVQALPTEDISTHTIYLVPKTGETNDVYDEYIYINDAWEMVGNTQIDLSNYVQKTDYATETDAGVIRVSSNYGLVNVSKQDTITGESLTYTAIMEATANNIKEGTDRYRIISSRRTPNATFYGLAKAAGDITQSASSNSVGQYTDEAKSAIQTMLDVPSNAAMTTAIGNAISSINSFDMAVVQELPTTDISTHTIYLVPKTGETNDVYDEYVYINNNWEMVGNTQIDLSGYALKSELPTKVSELSNDSGYLTSYTETDPTVPQWAKANTKPSYTAVEVGALPSDTHIPSTTAELTNDAGFITVEEVPEVPVQDVQVNGVSVLQDGVANVPVASESSFGVVKYSQSKGLAKDTNGVLYINTPNANGIKAGTDAYRPVVPGNQHISAFYGFAKAAGDSTQSQSDNTVGIYTTEAKAAIRSMIGAAASADVTVQDVQINGTSILENGVANVPIGSENEYGVVKPNYGLYVNASGQLNVKKAADSSIKSSVGDYTPVTPSVQHQSAFYGLAKAAGDTTQSQSSNAVGTYTPEAKGAIQKMLGITDIIATEENDLTASKAYAIGDIFVANGKLYKATAAIAQDATIILPDDVGANCEEVTIVDGFPHDVQVNGVSVVSNGVANIPTGSDSRLGVVKSTSGYGISITSSGVLYIIGAYPNHIKAGAETYRPLVPAHQHEATFYGLAKAAGSDEKNSSLPVGQYTEAAKSAIHEMLNGSVSVSGATPTINALPGVRYVCGEVSTITITVPASGIIDVVFTSGSTPAVLAINGTVRWANGFDPTALDANTIYEINIADGLGVAVGWT